MPSRPALVALGAAVIVLVLAGMAAGILTLFFLGIVIVYLIDPPISWMSRHHVPRWLGTLLMLAILAFLSLIPFWLFVFVGIFVSGFLVLVLCRIIGFLVRIIFALLNVLLRIFFFIVIFGFRF
jgi:predicted PurR-regulated permease PerM